MNELDEHPSMSGAAGACLWLLRAFLLWIYVLIAVLFWPIALILARGAKTAIPEFVGWVDLNMVAMLQRTLFRPFIKNRIAWTPFSQVADVRHRPSWFDSA